MNVSSDLARALLCPSCGKPLQADLVCAGPDHHHIEVEDDTLIFARPDVGKYDPTYAARYAALWAFGYVTLRSGLVESLYRTVSSLVIEAARTMMTGRPLIVDAGCGVGRTAADCARVLPTAQVFALDASPSMLAFARSVVLGKEPIDVELPAYGYPHLTIPPFGLKGPVFARADVEHLPVVDESADLVLSVNIIDRLPHGPDLALSEAHRTLKRGGTLIFTNPLNWTEPRFWERYGSAESVLALLTRSGFTIRTAFDDLRYHELIDARGSIETFRTVVACATKD